MKTSCTSCTSYTGPKGGAENGRYVRDVRRFSVGGFAPCRIPTPDLQGRAALKTLFTDENGEP